MTTRDERIQLLKILRDSERHFLPSASVRRFNRLVAAGALAFCVCIFAGIFWQTMAVAPGRFVIEDEDGRMRAWLDAHNDGGPGLILYDEKGVVIWEAR